MAGSNVAVLDVVQQRAAERRERRSKNPFKNYFHHAIRVADMEATRHFYEDIIGLPLTGADIVKVDPATKQPTNYIHTFFELSDGSFVAFFQLEDPIHPFIKRTPSPLDHVAVNVIDRQIFDQVYERIKANDIRHIFVDHEEVKSLYIYDPDGDLFEVALQSAGAEDWLDHRDAHERLKGWLSDLRK